MPNGRCQHSEVPPDGIRSVSQCMLMEGLAFGNFEFHEKLVWGDTACCKSFGALSRTVGARKRVCAVGATYVSDTVQCVLAT